MPEYSFKVFQPDNGKRLDLFLLLSLENEGVGISRTSIQRLISDGNLLLNGKSHLRSHLKVKTGDEVKIKIEGKKENSLKPEDIPLKIVYEDEDLAIIDKPIGLVVHPAPGNLEHTLVNALLKHFRELSCVNPLRPGIVHRLDKDTSGIMVIAKNNSAHLNLVKQFAQHSIKRKYVAIVKGRLEFDEDVIELPIGRHPLKRKNMAAGFGKNTKYAKTQYRTLKRSDKFSLLELEPFTGRTHQLRVHLSSLGYPILGDPKYGRGNEFSRLALHAAYLGFKHPRTDKFVEFSSEIPEVFKEFVNKNLA